MQPPGCHVAPDGTVTFTLRHPTAQSALVAGDFTRWAEGALPMKRADGADLWTAVARVSTPGLHAYKYLVDGAWIADPGNRLTRNDGVGGRNSAFVVGAADRLGWASPGEEPLGGDNAIRVASLNLHTYQERDPIDKLEQIALGMAAMGADLLLLQEVGEHVSDPARPNAGEIVRRHLEAFTGKPWDHAWREAHIGFDVYREGLSVISSAPLTEVERVELSHAGLSRVAVLATTAIKGVRLRVATTHISWVSAEAEAQLTRLLAALDASAKVDAAFVAGDFNCQPSGRAVALLRARGFTDAGAAAGVVTDTFLEGRDGRIDYHFLRPGGRKLPTIEAFARTFDGDSRHGFQPRVSDHAGLIGAYRWG